MSDHVLKSKGRRAATHSLRDGIIASLVVGACMGLLDALTSANITWRTALVTIITATLTSVVAYVRANYVTPYINNTIRSPKE